MTTPVPSAPVGPLSRALVEALESVAARDQVRSLIRGSLLAASLDAVPEDARLFQRFADGALRASVERTLGAGTADIVLEQLTHVVRMLSPAAVRKATGTGDDEDDLSGERVVESTPPPLVTHVESRPRPTAVPRPLALSEGRPSLDTSPLEAPILFPPRATSFESGTQQKRALGRISRPSREIEEVRPSSSGPRALATDVIVVSLDPKVVADVEGRLRGRSRVRGVVTAPELIAALGAVEGMRVAIVLDTGVPSIDLPTFVGLVPALPPGAHIVLWGMDDRHKARLVRVFPQVAAWSASNACESPVDVLLLAE